MGKLLLSNMFSAEAMLYKKIRFQTIRLTGVMLLLFLSSFSIPELAEQRHDKEDPNNQARDSSKRETIPFQEKGSFWQFSIGTLAGKNIQQETKGMPSFNFMYSYKFNRSVSAGFGIGLDIMDYMAAPAYFDLKLHLPVNRSYFPYFYIKSGKSFSVSDPGELNGMKSRNTGGFLIGTGAGIFLPGREDFRWFLQAGFRYNELNTELTQIWLDRKSNIIYSYQRLDVSIGVYFN